MHKHHANSFSFRLWASIFGGLFFLAIVGFYFFDVSAQTEVFEKPADRNLNDRSSNQSGNVQQLGRCQNGECGRNGRIAFERGGYIQTINSDGTGRRYVTSVPGAPDLSPNWSPDGRRIAFSTDRDGNQEIYTMNGDGSNLIRLTNNNASDRKPYYSPDGLTIVFTSNRDGNEEIYKMNADGSNQIRLTNDAVDQRDPAFSPDGQKILYVAGLHNSNVTPFNLFTMNVDGSNQQQIPGPADVPGQQYRSPTYSPDGAKIIFSYTTDFFVQTPRTWTMNADGSGRTLIGGYQGSYSPDGTKVVYTNFVTQTNQLSILYVANSDGSSPQSFAQTTFNGIVEGLDWQPVTRPAIFDYDGDGRSDVSIFRPSDGVWHMLRSQAGYTSFQFGLSTDVMSPADYDGDLKTDLAVWRPTDGNFHILNSFDNTVRLENFGLAGDIPTGGDWDGDGKADVAVYRSGSQSTFYYRGSLANPQGNITSISWGTSGDKAVAGDYDGDGLTDAAIYRNGVWWIRQTSNGQNYSINFGLANDVLVPADYDADGKTDQAVYRSGIWYIFGSAQGVMIYNFGISTDIPTPADYDGDGKSDAAIYRDGVWWILRSQTLSAESYSFGLSSDKPIPSAYVR